MNHLLKDDLNFIIDQKNKKDLNFMNMTIGKLTAMGIGYIKLGVVIKIMWHTIHRSKWPRLALALGYLVHCLGLLLEKSIKIVGQ